MFRVYRHIFRFANAMVHGVTRAGFTDALGAGYVESASVKSARNSHNSKALVNGSMQKFFRVGTILYMTLRVEWYYPPLRSSSVLRHR